MIPASSLGLFHDAFAIVLAPARDSDPTARTGMLRANGIDTPQQRLSAYLEEFNKAIVCDHYPPTSLGQRYESGPCAYDSGSSATLGSHQGSGSPLILGLINLHWPGSQVNHRGRVFLLQVHSTQQCKNHTSPRILFQEDAGAVLNK